MAKAIQFINEQIREFLNQQETGAYYDPDDIDNFIHMASLAKFSELFGNVKDYQPKLPVSRISNDVSQKVKDDLRAFKKAPETISISSGVWAIPDDYVHIDALRTSQGEQIDIVSEEEVAPRLKSHIDAPTEEYPIATIKSDGIHFYPSTLGEAVISYIKTPTKPKYAYTSSGRNYVYDDGNSTDVEWPTQVHNELIFRALSMAGVSGKDFQSAEYGELKTNQP